MNPLVLAILFLILKPIIKGLTEANKQKQKWEKRQNPKPKKSLEINTLESPQVEGKGVTLGKLIDYNPNVLLTDFDSNTTIPVKEGRRIEKPGAKRKVIPEVYEPKDNFDSFNLLDEDNILRGIILKEVLGPPKFFRR